MNAEIQQAELIRVPPGTQNVPILRLEVNMRGNFNPLLFTNMKFHNKGTPDITRAKIYYTDTNLTFNTDNLVGTAINTTNDI